MEMETRDENKEYTYGRAIRRGGDKKQTLIKDKKKDKEKRDENEGHKYERTNSTEEF